MAVKGIPVELVLDTGEGDPEYTEEQLQYLLAELQQIDLTSINRVSRAPAPSGTRAGMPSNWARC
ncbi:hypothetical protein OG585_52295 (plasmid) [Streptomyces sp. NBC_01340]|uniref:hypothetical protein n=1 Tax=Streptomyces sp. NBC_01340 TaxID=2903830 RepID=UPI002E11C549|nr:hypothetical protein OG585_52295 [Streptomyces sp. NBC_01340]